jgi:CheY-like chemotaxis protein
VALVLVVDDDVPSRQLFVSLLTPFGLQVIEAGDGKEGLEKAGLSMPNLIITDILMPTMNGYDFVSALRKRPPLENIPVIFASASFLDDAARSLGESCGVSLFINKPCDPEQVILTVHRALGLKMGVPTSPTQSSGKDAIPYLLDAFLEKGKELDAVNLRLAALLDLGLQLARPWEVQALLRKAGNAAREIVGANYAAVGIFKDSATQLESLTLIGMDSATVEKIEKPTFGGGIFHSMMAKREPQRVSSQTTE